MGKPIVLSPWVQEFVPPEGWVEQEFERGAVYSGPPKTRVMTVGDSADVFYRVFWFEG